MFRLTTKPTRALALLLLPVVLIHPDKRWRPVLTNQDSLGFYRPKILNQQLAPEE